MGKTPHIRPLDLKADKSGDGRLSTCINGLDARMSGGIPRGFTVLVAGPVGSLKSSISFSIALRAAVEGKKAMYISLEQDGPSILMQMRSLGLDCTGVRGFKLVDFSTVRKEMDYIEEKAEWLDSLSQLLDRYQNTFGFDVLIIDSLDALYSLVTLRNPRRELFHFFRKLKELGTTVLLISEMAPDERRYGKHGVEEFLSDGIIHLRLRESETASVTSVRRYVGVVKMRASIHDTDYHPFIVSKEGFELVLD